MNQYSARSYLLIDKTMNISVTGIGYFEVYKDPAFGIESNLDPTEVKKEFDNICR